MLAASGFYRWPKEAGKQFSFWPVLESLVERYVSDSAAIPRKVKGILNNTPQSNRDDDDAPRPKVAAPRRIPP
jgi:hypothetical protein